ncbi:MAG: 2-oxoacid:acceptor oxidoreductase subunit alpha [Desulfovibrio sp.]|jgi:2-oxoglutarate ferredoxin oxidoreductase subunit alpha|nr:2-oxoacid:acceptor oxidoreductase subunit alpha [Desulfovibrio sp.]
MEGSVKLTQGNEAIALGALYAGANFYAGYPITPSSEIAEICSREMLRSGGMFVQMEDEIGSMAAIIGASAAGAKAFTATSGPGFSLMQEHISAAVIMEMPVVVVDVQRAGPCVGLATKPAQSDMMQLRWGRHGDQTVVALIPSSVRECFELAVEAFNIAEELRVPVILAPDEIVGHCRENFKMPAPGALPVSNRKKPTCRPEEYKPFSFAPGSVAPLAAFGSEYVFQCTSAMNGESGVTNADPANAIKRVDQLYTKLEQARQRIVKYKTFYVEDCDTLLIAYGGSARASRVVVEELRAEGKKVGMFQIITAWPFPGAEIADCVRNGVKSVYVPEMNHDGQVAGEIRKYVANQDIIHQINKFNGEILTPEDIYEAMRRQQ